MGAELRRKANPRALSIFPLSSSAEEAATSKNTYAECASISVRSRTQAVARHVTPMCSEGKKKAASVVERAGGTKMLNPIELSLRGSHVRQGVLDSVRRD
jgi:hypothetical protein